MASAQEKTETLLRKRAAMLGVPYQPPFGEGEKPVAPQLDRGNEVVIELFYAVSSQLIVGASVIGISHDTLDRKMDWLGVPEEERWDVFERFSLLERLYVKSCNRGEAT